MAATAGRQVMSTMQFVKRKEERAIYLLKGRCRVCFLSQRRACMFKSISSLPTVSTWIREWKAMRDLNMGRDEKKILNIEGGGG